MSVVIVCCQLSINMRRTLKFILWITILLFGAGLYSMNTDFLAYEMSLPDTEQPVVPDDTVPKVRTRFPDSTPVKSVYICNKTGKMILCIKLQADSNFTGR